VAREAPGYRGGARRGFVPQAQATNQRLITCGGVRLRPTPMYCAARAGGVATDNTCGGTPAAGYNPAEGTSRRGTRSRRRYITARVTLQLVRIKPVLFPLSRVHICRVVLLMLRQRTSSKEKGRWRCQPRRTASSIRDKPRNTSIGRTSRGVYRSRPSTERCEARSRGAERFEQLQPTASTCLHPCTAARRKL
jgi:hypothetical protein